MIITTTTPSKEPLLFINIWNMDSILLYLTIVHQLMVTFSSIVTELRILAFAVGVKPESLVQF